MASVSTGGLAASPAVVQPDKAQTVQPLPARAARWLLGSLIIIQFFPIPPLPGLGVAPENFLFLATALYLMGRVLRMLSRDRRVLLLVMLFLAFGVLQVFHFLVHTGSLVLPYEYIRAIVFILALAEVGAHEVMLQKLIKLLLIIGAIQIVFGLLNYVFGQPFTGIRNWMQQVSINEAFISKGSQLAGLYGAPHIFAYLLAAFPVLCLAMFLIERRLVWLGWMFLMLLGLFINAERAALGGLAVCSLVLVWKSGRSVRAVAVVVLVGLTVLGVQLVAGYLDLGTTRQDNASHVTGTLGTRLGGTTAEEVFSRVEYQFLAARSVLRHPLIGPSWPQFAREVRGKDASELLVQQEIETTMASHNHYVNLGMNGGVLGWVVGFWFIRILWRMHRISVERYAGRRVAYIRHGGIVLALLATMINAFFHNAGIFSPELVASCLVGLLIADYRLALRTPPRNVQSRQDPAQSDVAEPSSA